MNQERFECAKQKIIGLERQRHGIGTLSEKTIHAIIKNYLEPNEDCHEIPINGYVADIYNSGSIIEVQTANFNKLRPKLSVFLNDYEVTIAYPIPYIKWLGWIDVETKEQGKLRKSPKKGNPYEIFIQLYKIKQFLNNPNIKFKILMINMEELRLLNGWSYDKKRGSTRYDRIPTELVEEIDIESVKDYARFVPINLADEFTVKDFAKEAGINIELARLCLNILTYTNTVKRVGKSGNAIIYNVSEL